MGLGNRVAADAEGGQVNLPLLISFTHQERTGGDVAPEDVGEEALTPDPSPKGRGEMGVLLSLWERG
ncbi:MAG: hypothetical protein Fur0044_44820 [Anaerolineae bacterium]